MSSKRQEEKIEKIVRGLMKLPPNRKCINCNSLGPQYVCTNFWTFVCTACSGIHREFTHRVKSVSMAKFTTQEVEALQRGGNQIARENFLKDWDMQQMRFPNSSNPDKIREFIKDVYVNKKYAGSRHSGKPPRDVESFKDHGLEQRRASSYHSFSQSPPYEYQYEDRRYGKQFGMLNRKPGSDQGPYDGKMNSFMYSPGRLHMQTYEDKFSNESSGSRMSDFSVSSAGDTFRYDGQSLNSQCSSPSLYHGSDITTEDGRPQAFNRLAQTNVKDQLPGPKRTLSAGSFASASVGDFALEPVHMSGTQQAKTSTFSSTQSSASACPGNKNSSNSTFVQEPMVSSPSVDLFSNFSNQPSSLGQVENKLGSGSVSNISLHSLGISDIASGHVHLSGQQQPNTSTFSSTPIKKNNTFGPTWVQPSETSSDLFDNFNNQLSSTISTEHQPAAVSIPQNEGWATFDLPHHLVVDSTLHPGISALELPGSGVANINVDGLASMHHSIDRFPAQNPTDPGPLPMKFSQWQLGPQEHAGSTEENNLQLWDAFEKVDETSVGGLPQSRSHLPAPDSPFHDSNITLKVLEDFDKDWFQKPATDSLAPGSGHPFASVVEPPYSSSVNPLTLDLSSFEAALPSSQLTNDYLASIAQPRFSQNTAVAHVSPLSEGGLQYMPGQQPSTLFPSFPSQGPGASVGGNPFA